MLIKPDFADVQDSVAPGQYKVRVIDGKVDKWEGKDGKPETPFINWRMETFDEADDKNNGRSIFHRTPYVGKGAFQFRDFYKACTKRDFPNGEDFDPEMLYGSEIRVTVVEGKNRKTGEPTGYTDIKAVSPL